MGAGEVYFCRQGNIAFFGAAQGIAAPLFRRNGVNVRFTCAVCDEKCEHELYKRSEYDVDAFFQSLLPQYFQ